MSRRYVLASTPDKVRRRRNELQQRRAFIARLSLRGITLDQYHSMMERQDFGCAICGKEFTGVTACIDHCHGTERVRGLLCPVCNMGLGMFKDDSKKLSAAISYLAMRSGVVPCADDPCVEAGRNPYNGQRL